MSKPRLGNSEEAPNLDVHVQPRPPLPATPSPRGGQDREAARETARLGGSLARPCTPGRDSHLPGGEQRPRRRRGRGRPGSGPRGPVTPAAAVTFAKPCAAPAPRAPGPGPHRCPPPAAPQARAPVRQAGPAPPAPPRRPLPSPGPRRTMLAGRGPRASERATSRRPAGRPRQDPAAARGPALGPRPARAAPPPESRSQRRGTGPLCGLIVRPSRSRGALPGRARGPPARSPLHAGAAPGGSRSARLAGRLGLSPAGPGTPRRRLPVGSPPPGPAGTRARPPRLPVPAKRRGGWRRRPLSSAAPSGCERRRPCLRLT